jgi:proline iminopeptidase
METGAMIFGLEERLYGDLAGVFRRYPTIEQVLIFGSRAKGTAKSSSDIDLAIMAPGMSDQEFSRLWGDLDGLPLVFKMDVLHLERLTKPELKNRIMAEGQFFFPLSMERLLSVREAIYNLFQGGPWLDFLVSKGDRYAAYYMSMYLLQDTGEALHGHRQHGFSAGAMQAYLEFWGVMQALVIQQDAICELYQAVKGCKLAIKPNSA